MPTSRLVISRDLIGIEALRRGRRYYSYGSLIVIRDADTDNSMIEVYYGHLSPETSTPAKPFAPAKPSAAAATPATSFPPDLEVLS